MLLNFFIEMPSQLFALFADAGSAAAAGETFVHSIGKKVIVAVSGRGRVYALDSITGAVRWSRQLTSTPCSTDLHVVDASFAGGVQVLVDDGASGAPSIVVLDVLTGTQRGSPANSGATAADAAAAAAAAVRKVLRVAMPASAEAAAECAQTGDDHTCRARRATVLARSDGSASVVGGGEYSAADVAKALAAGAHSSGRLYFQHVDLEAGVVSGLVLEAAPGGGGGLRNREVWSLPLGDARGPGALAVLEACALVDAHEKTQVIGLPFGEDGE
jgi:hypothetical protein